MLSVMSVTGMRSFLSSQAVSRAPWRNGRVSQAMHLDALARLDRGADDAERRAVARGGERARVAVGQDRGAVLDQLGAVPPERRG